MGRLAAQLRRGLNDRDMTQGALSTYSGVDQPTISRILHGRNENPGIEVIVALARALRVSLDWLVLGLDSKDAPMLPPDEDALLAAYRACKDEALRAFVLEAARNAAKVQR